MMVLVEDWVGTQNQVRDGKIVSRGICLSCRNAIEMLLYLFVIYKFIVHIISIYDYICKYLYI